MVDLMVDWDRIDFEFGIGLEGALMATLMVALSVAFIDVASIVGLDGRLVGALDAGLDSEPDDTFGVHLMINKIHPKLSRTTSSSGLAAQKI